jgi:hypothetical protein
VLALGRKCTSDDLAGGVIPAHGVDRDHGIGDAGARERHTVGGPAGISRASQLPGAVWIPGTAGVPGCRGVSSAPRTAVLAVPGRGSPILAVRRRAQRITGCAAADDASSFVSFNQECGVLASLWP